MKNKKKSENPGNDDINSLISSLLKPIFSLIYQIIPEKITLSRYIWYLITLVVLLFGLKEEYFNINTLLIVFVSLLVLEFSSLNFETIKTFFKKKDKDKIKDFLSDIMNKDLETILKFLDEFNLKSKELEILLKTRYNTNIDLHKKIIKTQEITSDFIDFLIFNKYADKIPKQLLSRYILWCNTSLNENSLKYFCDINSSEIKGALVLTHLLLVESKNIYQKLLKPFLIISTWISNLFRKKQLKVVMLFIFTFVIMLVFGSLSPMSYTLGGNQIFNYVLSYFVASMFFAALILILISSIYFKITIPLFGSIYRSSSIKC